MCILLWISSPSSCALIFPFRAVGTPFRLSAFFSLFLLSAHLQPHGKKGMARESSLAESGMASLSGELREGGVSDEALDGACVCRLQPLLESLRSASCAAFCTCPAHSSFVTAVFISLPPKTTSDSVSCALTGNARIGARFELPIEFWSIIYISPGLAVYLAINPFSSAISTVSPSPRNVVDMPVSLANFLRPMRRAGSFFTPPWPVPISVCGAIRTSFKTTLRSPMRTVIFPFLSIWTGLPPSMPPSSIKHDSSEPASTPKPFRATYASDAESTMSVCPFASRSLPMRICCLPTQTTLRALGESGDSPCSAESTSGDPDSATAGPNCQS